MRLPWTRKAETITLTGAAFLEDVFQADLNDELERRGVSMRVVGLCPQYDGDNYIGAHLLHSQGTIRLPWATAEIQASYQARQEWAREAASAIIDQDVKSETFTCYYPDGRVETVAGPRPEHGVAYTRGIYAPPVYPSPANVWVGGQKVRTIMTWLAAR